MPVSDALKLLAAWFVLLVCMPWLIALWWVS